jgi:hypothetical protein
VSQTERKKPSQKPSQRRHTLTLDKSDDCGGLAVRLGMGKPVNASQFVIRWLQAEAGKRAMHALLSGVKV